MVSESCAFLAVVEACQAVLDALALLIDVGSISAPAARVVRELSEPSHDDSSLAAMPDSTLVAAISRFPLLAALCSESTRGSTATPVPMRLHFVVSCCCH